MTAAVALLLPHAQAAVPHTESFEDLPAGFAISGLADWSPLDEAEAIVSTNAAAITGLADYLAGAAAPLATNHAKVLSIQGPVSLATASPAGRLVRTDMLLQAWPRLEPLPDDPSLQCAVTFANGGMPTIFHRDAEAGTNAWLALSSAPTVSSGQWCRVTFLNDYANHYFQIAFDGGPPVSDAAGWSGPGGTHPGTWFRMVQTNAALASIEWMGSGQAYVDDILVESDLPKAATLPATNITASTADLCGALSSTGFAATAVEVYWGDEDGGDDPGAWDAVARWPAPQLPGPFAFTATGLAERVYFYRYAATNAFGSQWADTVQTLTPGAVTVVAVDTEAGERPPNAGTFRISRPAGTTNGPLSVTYAVSGSAQAGLDYVALPGAMTIPAGVASTDVIVTPIRDDAEESPETVVLTLQPGPYRVGSPDLATVNLADAPAVTLLWDNSAGSMNWNSAHTNWFGGDRFYPRDAVIFNAAATGRLYIGTAAWNGAAGMWTNAAPADVLAGAMTVIAGSYEFEGGAVTHGTVTLAGGSLTDRELARDHFSDGPIILRGGTFRRQLPEDETPRSQTCTNALRVEASSALHGVHGQNDWTGGLELAGRLAVGQTSAVARVHHVTGPLVLSQDTNSPAARGLAAFDSESTMYLDGSITDDPDPAHTGAFPLTLEIGGYETTLLVRGTNNTYGSGTVIVNSTRDTTNDVVVTEGASLGTGPVTVMGTGAVLRVRAAGAIRGALQARDGGTVWLETTGALGADCLDIRVGPNAMLAVAQPQCIPVDASLTLLPGGTVFLTNGINETVYDMEAGGVPLLRGTYDAKKLPAYIRGSGSITVRSLGSAQGMLLQIY